MTRIIGIVSGKGGVGKTTFTTNIALALSKLGQKTIIVDCNVTTPHLNYYLGGPEYGATINEVLKGNLDIKTAVSHFNGVMFIPASTKIEDLEGVDIRKLKNHVRKLQIPEIIDFVLLDSAPGLGREAVSVLESADEVIFVTTPTVPNIHDVNRCAEVAKEIGIKKMNLVLNMTNHSDFEFHPYAVEDLLKIDLLGFIPFDRNIVNSVAAGKPLIKHKPNSRASREFMRIASSLTGIPYRSSRISKIPDFLKRFLFNR